MKSLIIATSVILALATPASAISYRGLAVTPCQIFVDLDYTEQKDWFPAKQWMYGYLSGLNVAFDYLRQENPMSQLEFDAVYDYSLRYCKDNADKLIIDALISFSKDLMLNN